MKRVIIFLLIVVCFISLNSIVNAEEVILDETDLEYYHVTYEFINSNDYYVTYKFKPKNHALDRQLFISDNVVTRGSVEHNVDEPIISFSDYVDSFEMSFRLTEIKEYYIRYKASIKGEMTTNYALGVNPICIERGRYVGDYSGALEIDSLKVEIVNPEEVKLTEDSFYNISDLVLIKDNGIFILEGNINDGTLSNYYYNSRFTVYEDDYSINSIIIICFASLCIAIAVALIIVYRKKIINFKKN